MKSSCKYYHLRSCRQGWFVMPDMNQPDKDSECIAILVGLFME
ncbi:hypothetical protein [Bacteroides sp.]